MKRFHQMIARLRSSEILMAMYQDGHLIIECVDTPYKRERVHLRKRIVDIGYYYSLEWCWHYQKFDYEIQWDYKNRERLIIS